MNHTLNRTAASTLVDKPSCIGALLLCPWLVNKWLPQTLSQTLTLVDQKHKCYTSSRQLALLPGTDTIMKCCVSLSNTVQAKHPDNASLNSWASRLPQYNCLLINSLKRFCQHVASQTLTCKLCHLLTKSISAGWVDYELWHIPVLFHSSHYSAALYQKSTTSGP